MDLKENLIRYSDIITILFTLFLFLLTIPINFFMASYISQDTQNRIHVEIQSQGLSLRQDVNIALENMTNDTNDNFHRQNSRLNDLETKLPIVSTHLAAFQALIQSYIMNTTSQNLSAITDRLDAIDARLVALNASLNLSAPPPPQTSTIPPSPIELRWGNLSCYHEVCANFGQYCDPEWLCSASLQVPDYAQWRTAACACAALGGVNV